MECCDLSQLWLGALQGIKLKAIGESGVEPPHSKICRPSQPVYYKNRYSVMRKVSSDYLHVMTDFQPPLRPFSAELRNAGS